MSRKFLIVGILLAGLLALAFYQLRFNSSPGKSTKLFTEAAPEDVLNHIRGLNSPLVLVNFWASWCEPCKLEFPGLLALKEKMEPKGLKVVFVSIDDPKDAENAQAFLRSQHVNFQTFFKGSRGLDFVTQIYPKWEGALPTTLLIGPEMKILDAWEGETTPAEFEERVLRHLSGS